MALGANYQYSHSIDDAGSVGGTSSVVAQNWQNILAEEGNSSFDVRHKVSGTYLYELPFGKDKFWITTGKWSHIMEGFSVSGTFTFATGTPLTPSYQATINDVARGTAGTERPDRIPGVSLTAGGGSSQALVQHLSLHRAHARQFWQRLRQCVAQLDPGPGTIQNNMSLSKTMQLGETRSFEIRATANNVFNTVQYSGSRYHALHRPRSRTEQSLRTGNFRRRHALFSIQRKVQVLMRSIHPHAVILSEAPCERRAAEGSA